MTIVLLWTSVYKFLGEHYVFNSFGYIPSRTARSCGNCITLKNCQIFFQRGCTIFIPFSNAWRFQFLHVPQQLLLLSSFFNYSWSLSTMGVWGINLPHSQNPTYNYSRPSAHSDSQSWSWILKQLKSAELCRSTKLWSIEKILHVSGPSQLKLMLYKGQLCIHPSVCEVVSHYLGLWFWFKFS